MILLLVLTFVQTYININSQEKNMQMFLQTCGNRVVELVRASTHNSMLANMKETSYQIIDKLSLQEGIENIRIIDKKGNIVYSKNKDELNKIIDKNNNACTICHSNSKEVFEYPLTKNKIRIFTKNNTRFLSVAASIKNDKSCSDAGCHYHDVQQKVIASLDVVLSLENVDAILVEEEAHMKFLNILVTFILAVTAGTFLWVFVHIPVRKLTEATRQISRGNLDYKTVLHFDDEMRTLAESFNKMTDDLKDAQNEITSWSNELENRVNLKTLELEQTQDRILQIEKMASLGKLFLFQLH